MYDLFEFKEGDIVTCAFFGDREFTVFENTGRDYTIGFRYDDDAFYYFTKDGRYHEINTHPVLKLVLRQKKMVKKEFRKVIYRIRHSVVESITMYSSENHFNNLNRDKGGKFLCFSPDLEPEVREVEE